MTPEAAILALFERHGIGLRQPAEWAPSLSDWRRLAVSLAIAAKEPGFAFEYAKPADLVNDADSIRDRYVREQMRPGITLERACRAAKKRLDSDIADGRWAHVPKLKPIGAAAMETGFSKRDARSKREMRAHRLGLHTVRTELHDRYHAFMDHAESLEAAAQRLTASEAIAE